MFSGLENFPSPSVCSVSGVLFRLFGSAEHSGRSESRVRNQASAGRASFAFGLFRFRGSVSALRVGGTRGAVEIEGAKSGFEIGLRRVECFSERKTSFDYIFVYNIKRKGWYRCWYHRGSALVNK